MPVIRHMVKDEIRIIFIEVASLVEGAAIEQSGKEILEAIEKSEESCVVLHFGRVTFMSSAALGMLVRINKKCKEYKVALRLSNISKDIRQVFKITGLDKIFSIHDDVAGAIEAFTKGGQLYFRKKAPPSYEVREKP